VTSQGARDAQTRAPAATLIRLWRVALVAAMAITALSVWTGVPLLGLWVGSMLVGDSGLTMLAVGAVAATILIGGLACVKLLAVLSRAHDELTGRPRTVRRHTPWLRSMSGERPHDLAGAAAPLSAAEYVLVGAVIVCYLVFEIWFFFLSGSSLGGPSGR
jgi:hypothetical protein